MLVRKYLLATTGLFAACAANAQTCSAPGPATAAGYTTQTFGGPPAANWLPSSPSGTGTTKNADGSITIASPTNNNWGGQLQTWNNGQGAAFGGGFYTQATLSWSGNYTGGQNGTAWPAFWADGQEAMTSAAAHTSWIEPDFMEAWGNNNWSGTLHSWAGGGASNIQTSSGGIVTPGFDPSVPHTYGFLWVPATASSQGKAEWFLNGQQVGKTVTWSQGEGPYASMDDQHFALFLGTGNNPMTVSDVQVWQNPATANNIGASPTAAASGCAPVQPSLHTAIESPPPAALQEVTPGQGAIASNGNAWSVSSDGHAMVNDTPIPGGGGTSAIEVVDGVVWGQDNGKGPSPCSDCWFTLSADGQDWTPKPGESPFGVPVTPAPSSQPQPPVVCGTEAHGGTFRTAGGRIIGPGGKDWIARGLNLYDDQIDQVAEVIATFTGINFTRVNIHSYQDPAAYQSFVAQMTSRGTVVEFEDHSDGAGGGQSSSPPMGMAAELSWYASMAKAYADNAYVWFGTFNEPRGTGNLSQWQKSTYDAVRGAGNTNPVIIYSTGELGVLQPGVYASMTNIIWDVHFYGGGASGSTDQALSASVASSQSIQSADGLVPAIVGEYGDSMDGTEVDSNGIDAVTSVITAATNGKNSGAAAWHYNPGGQADHVTQGGRVTDPYGLMVQLYINTDVVPLSPCQSTAATQQAINDATKRSIHK